MKQIVKDMVYDKQASQASKNAIFCWLLIGFIYIVISPVYKVFSLVGLLVVFPGIFIASIAAVPLFILKNKIALRVIENGKEELLPLIKLIKFLEILEVIFAPIIFIRLIT